MNCATSAVNNALAGVQGLVLGMCVGSTTGNATYNAANKTITFQTFYATAHQEVFRHELFHAFQDNVAYSGDIGTYSLGSSGFVNIEFEQAVFTDLMEGYGTALDHADPQTIISYNQWIKDLTNSGQQYPNLSSAGAAFETKYFEYLTEFNNSDPVYGGGTIKNTLNPEALKNIFNGLVKGNCGN